jgi:GWxTD domain-containing protein
VKIPGKRLGVLVVAMTALATACVTTRALKSLDDESREFLSKVRYIITRQERERFLAIPAGDRKAFVAEFWEKRVVWPATSASEFRDQYYARIAEANHLFSEAAEPGWLQDRGRVYILLGPPTNRITYPRGITFYGVPTEIWYYGFFPIVFTDEAWNGNYKLDPVNVEQITILNRAQKEWQPQIDVEEEAIGFRVKVKKAGPGRAVIRIEVPLRDLRVETKDRTVRTTFILTLDLLEMNGKEVRQSRTETPLEMTEDKFQESQAGNHVIEVPIEAPAGDYWLRMTLENAADGSKAYRRVRLSL